MCLHVIECSSTTTAALQTKAIKRVKGDDWVEIHELATCILLQFLINSERKKRNRHCLIRRPYPAYHGSRKGTPRCCVKRARKAFYLRFVLCSFIFRFSFFFFDGSTCNWPCFILCDMTSTNDGDVLFFPSNLSGSRAFKFLHCDSLVYSEEEVNRYSSRSSQPLDFGQTLSQYWCAYVNMRNE